LYIERDVFSDFEKCDDECGTENKTWTRSTRFTDRKRGRGESKYSKRFMTVFRDFQPTK